ncbi:MAG: hypothetical protein IPJ75_04945 [Ignavibacteriales bacterium]|nr:hypothetical protein [Ignavibacteriales bacterium]
MIKNPPRYIFEAAAIIRNIELDEMLRGLEYNLTGEYFPFDFKEFVRSVSDDAFVETPVRGI